MGLGRGEVALAPSLRPGLKDPPGQLCLVLLQTVPPSAAESRDRAAGQAGIALQGRDAPGLSGLSPPPLPPAVSGTGWSPFTHGRKSGCRRRRPPSWSEKAKKRVEKEAKVVLSQAEEQRG